MTRATSAIDDCIDKLKMSQNEKKKGYGGKHTRPKKWSGARRPAGPATTALIKTSIMSFDFPLLNISNCQLVFKYLSLYGNLFIFT